MKTRRHTADSHAPVSGNENVDIPSAASSTQPLTTASSYQPVTTASSSRQSATTTSAPEPLITIPLKSEVWEYFERCSESAPLKAKCLSCEKELLTPNYGTSSLKRHLEQRHGLKQFGSTQISSSPIIPIKLSKFETTNLNSLAINAIIKDARVYGDFQKSGMKKFIDALKPGKRVFDCSLISKIRIENLRTVLAEYKTYQTS